MLLLSVCNLKRLVNLQLLKVLVLVQAGKYGVALGRTTKANAGAATALGNAAEANIANGVALGSSSVTTTDKGVVGYNPSDSTYRKYTNLQGNVQKATTAAVSIGNGETLTRQLTGLAAGTADTDAVNVAQLKNVGVARDW